MSFPEYLKQIETNLQSGQSTEHTHRAALQVLIESLSKGIRATNEPKRIKCGAPDYIVTQGQTVLGYIEAKDVGKSLEKEERSQQMARYLKGLGNLILTNYLEFRWYVGGEHRLTAQLAKFGSNKKLKLEENGVENVTLLLNQFLTVNTPTVNSPKELAKRMASIAQLIRDAIQQAFVDADEGGTLKSQLESFRKVLLGDLTQAQFADMYAQTICYGMFAACCNTQDISQFSRRNAPYELPKTNPFLRDMFGHIAGPNLDERIAWAVDDLAELLKRTAMDEILKDFGKRTRQEDPVVHFYETFLAEYDPKMREARGVYYTPEPVVSYIVRSVDRILKNDFGIKKGLADDSKIKVPSPDGKSNTEIHQVLILDPATGTGTFLHGIIDHIYETFKNKKGMWSGYVSQHLLPRLFGFELLMAPYTVAHIKLGLQLKELGYDFEQAQRLQIYLTNTLQEAFQIPPADGFTDWIRDEADKAKDIKQDIPVMVVLGNPPYSGHSANTEATWISNLLRGKDTLKDSETGSYFKLDGKPLGEKNPKWLNDDYVKFIRFAHWKIEQTGYGILAFITNHGYLDNPTFRGMRQSLMETFDDIYILDLHGNSKKKESSPDGSKDENVFDIQQGVAIGIFIKGMRHKKKNATVHHADLYGVREVYENSSNGKQLVGGKYHWLWENDLATTQWKTLAPQSPFYLFVPQEIDLLAEYEAEWQVTDIFSVNSVGIVTARDALTIHFSENDIWKTVTNFANLLPEEARTTYNLGKDARDWKVEFAQRDVKIHPFAETQKSGPFKEFIRPILYRPFDVRYTYYTGKSRGFLCMPRSDVMKYMLGGKNIALHLCRQTVSDAWQHIMATNQITDDCYVSNKTRERGYTLPLYLYPETEAEKQMGMVRRPNLASEFIKDFSSRLQIEFIPDGKGDKNKTFGPEDVFDYMYAVFHSPTYRTRYAEFLKIDFPRLPLTSNPDLFRTLCNFGNQLVKLHLLEESGNEMATYPITGDDIVESVRYTEAGENAEKGRVWINNNQYFEGIPPSVWNFHIGGYKVCEKWLKDRKGRQLSYDDLEHYQKIVLALAETIKLMDEIDKAITEYGGYPIE
ncbi:type ISP restriction/modification enzyme [Aerosakkonema sp. BLCC-F183]|uniref:type ISP restriction/modification enzyme n=1 Tax=Aerosakkonema sp. BLCC-F183 TaxID=3342834 RepID=UPI0035BB201F